MTKLPCWAARTSASLLFMLLLSVGGFACHGPPSGDEDISLANCPLGPAVETAGHQRLALIVGVGDYRSERVPDLAGPPNDARRIYELLTGKGGYGFPKQNVCLLLDAEATTRRFRKVFEKALVDRAQPDDVAVFYFAGHGSQTRDRNGDEPDEWDETFLFHDARTPGVHDLVDDELNRMLAHLHHKTHHIAVILDSCNSGTATRAPEAGTFVARYQPPEEETREAAAQAPAGGDGRAGWLPEAMPGLVAFTAASDGTPALENAGRGIFTDALLRVLSGAGDKPMTYAQAARQTAPLVAANSYQIPYFQGDLTAVVFGNETRARPAAWEVIRVGPPLELGGPPTPGIGKGAELRIYDGAVTGADTRDPAKAKATVVVTERPPGLNAEAQVSAARPDAPAIVPGDLGVLVRPADEVLKLVVRLRPAGEPGGIATERAAHLRAKVAADPEADMLVTLTEGPGDFELSVDSDGRLVLRGPENAVRDVYAGDDAVPTNLWQHARRRALLQLRGEGGSAYTDDQTLLVRLVPARRQNSCARGIWDPAKPNSEQVIPLCHAWNVEVELSRASPTPLLVGGVVLSTDGSLFGFPFDGRKVLLKPGEKTVFEAEQETFMATLPLEVQDRVMMFGTRETNPVAWHLLTETARTRDLGPPKVGLYGALDRYLRGSRGVGRAEQVVEDSTWTLSTVTMRVSANARFLPSEEAPGQPIRSREYTIPSFDIRPYLPDDQTTALYKVLREADWLAHASVRDGFSYKQHPWTQPTDEQNLRLGIDCSRAIWFAFTRAGLPYNKTDSYLSTAQMVSAQSPMADGFQGCSDDPNLRLGDILVYRDDRRGDGHVVMVIDPVKRIAWGSHGWDGNAKETQSRARHRRGVPAHQIQAGLGTLGPAEHEAQGLLALSDVRRRAGDRSRRAGPKGAGRHVRAREGLRADGVSRSFFPAH